MTSENDFRKWFENLYFKRENYVEYIRGLADQREHTVFYGCGAIYKNIRGTWDKHIGRRIDFCCDRDPAKWGKLIGGVRCISPEELFKIKDKCAVFITTGHLVEVHNFLKSHGCECVHELYKYSIIASEELGCMQACDIDKICRVHEALEDERSKSLFRAIARRVFDVRAHRFVMLDFSEKNQYFPKDVIRLSEHESFVDAGAYTGDTLAQFLDRTGRKFDDYYAFELDSEIFKVLESNAGALKTSGNIKLFNEGLWDEKGTVAFTPGDSDSTIGAGDKKGAVVRLDDALGGAKVTFIKMDIEGAELNALRGAQAIIRRWKPALAICVYHSLRDLWEIPLYIKELAPEYKIHLRHHTDYEYETVCYATPEWRRPK